MSPSRSPRALLLALLAVLALPVLVAPGPASAAELLLSRQLPGSSWTAVSVTTDGAQVSSTLRATDVARPFQAGVRVYDSQRRVVYAATLSALGGAEGVLVQAQAAGVAVEHDTRRQDPARLADIEVSVVLNEGDSADLVGRYTVLLWSAARGAGPGSWRVEGRQGVAAGPALHGGETFLFDSSDFSGTLTAQVGTGGLAARAGYDTERAVRVRRTLVGSFAPVLTSVDVMSVRLPNGSTRSCVPVCEFSGSPSDPVAPPGEYLFRLSGAGAGGGLQNAGDVLLGGADVVLPAA